MQQKNLGLLLSFHQCKMYSSFPQDLILSVFVFCYFALPRP
jgi:hypothetical protein